MYEAMGRLHRALATTTTTPPRPAVATYGPPRSSRRWLAETERAALDDEARAVADHARRLRRRLERTWVPATALPNQLVHGDVRLGNVATAPTSDRPVYLDFGFAALRPRIHELAYSLLWIVLRPDDSGRPEGFRWDQVRELVDAYEHGAGTTLDERERAAFAPYLAAVPIYFAAVAGYMPDPSSTLRGEVPSLRIAEWVLDHAADLT
jgi:Ser/Thr protein kinase RdoA (MazF antagonist)